MAGRGAREARAATGRDVLPASGALNYLRRHGGVMSYLYGSKYGEVFEEPTFPSDRGAYRRPPLGCIGPVNRTRPRWYGPRVQATHPALTALALV